MLKQKRLTSFTNITVIFANDSLIVYAVTVTVMSNSKSVKGMFSTGNNNIYFFIKLLP